MNDSDCRKCGAPMSHSPPPKSGFFAGVSSAVTGYACKVCGHWNNLKRRKANKISPQNKNNTKP